MATKRLLVLDDEPDFGAFVRRVAEGLGFEVTVLDRATEFRSSYQTVQPDIVVLDIVMPQIDGIELVSWLAEIDSRARVILVSGYNPHYADAAEVLAKSKGRFPVTSLLKPVSLDKLEAALLEFEEPSTADR